MEAETLLGDGGDKTGARLEIGVIELAIAWVLLKMIGVFGREKCALVVVKPPGDFWRTGIFEIDDGIFVAVKIGFIEKRSGAMQQARVNKLDIVADAFRIKPRKKRSRRSPIKTPIMVENLNLHALPFSPGHPQS